MNNRLLLRAGCGTVLASLFMLCGATATMAQTPPRRIPPRIVTPPPPPAEEAEPAAEEAPAPTPSPAPRQIRRVAPIVTSPTPATVPVAPPVRRVPTTTPTTDSDQRPTQSTVAPHRRPPVITTPPTISTSIPDNSEVRRVPPVVTTPPAPPPTGPVRPRRVPPVITTPTPADTAPGEVRRRPPVITTPASDGTGEVRRRPPVITTPSTEGVGDVRRRPPVITNVPPGDARRRPPVVTSSDGEAAGDPAQPPVIVPSDGRPQTPVRPRPGSMVNVLATELVPPAEGQTLPLSGSVTLRRGAFDDMIRTLPVAREISGAQLRANPMVKVGKSQLDFRKMLDNPMALINVADRLGRMPDLVDVRPGKLTAYEIGKGVVVRDFLSYSFKPGACTTAESRARIAATGVSCFTRSSAADIDSSYARAGSLRYVRDPVKRAQALSEAKAERNRVGQDIDKRVADFRARLADPAMRAELASAVGDAEVARLEALDDTSLAGELINNSDNLIEQVFYVPTNAPPQEPVTPAPPPAPKVEDVSASYPLGTHTYLAGFTLGRDFEWSQGVYTTIKWCLFGCKESYYAKVSAGFGYKFGLRFPIQLTGTYDYALKDGAQSGTVTANVATINGSAADYASTKLPGNLVYDGKELVASFSAHAGVGAKLPLVGQLGPIDIPLLDYDLTTLLPGDFTNGQFKPPEPGKPGPSAPFILEQLDLLGGSGNFGVLGAKVFPAVDVRMDSTLLSLTLTDKFAGNKTTILPAGTASVPVALKNGAAEFNIGNPQYGIKFTLTPGLNARLFIDLAVWGAKVDWPVWFPQLAVTVPSDGLKFECHEGTVCSQEFRFTPNGAQSLFLGRVEQWGMDFEALWVPKCIDDTCRFGVRLARNKAVFEGKKMDADNPGGDLKTLLQAMNPFYVEAAKRAAAYVAQAQARKSQEVSNAMGILAQAIWTKQCEDSLCFDNITALTMQMGPRAAEIANATPSLGTMKINQQVNKEFVPKFQKEVDDSKLRQSMATAALAAKQAKMGKQPKLIR